MLLHVSGVFLHNLLNYEVRPCCFSTSRPCLQNKKHGGGVSSTKRSRIDMVNQNGVGMNRSQTKLSVDS